MPLTLTPETAAALRAQLGFLRDLGIYDFYRRPSFPADETLPAAGAFAGKEAPGAGIESVVDAKGDTRVEADASSSAGAVEIAGAPAAVAEPPAAPQSAAATEWPAPLAVTGGQSHHAAASPSLGERDIAPAPAADTDTDVPFQGVEDPEIAARKRSSVLAPPLELPGIVIPAAERAQALANIRAEIGDCTRCPLAFEGRHTIVFGDGSPSARIVFVGEGPGADEDAQGVPFIGKAGQLLNNMITAMGLRREDVYIANIVKCRPPGNRVPEPMEANTCTPFLMQQLGVVRPEIIVALGSTAATYLLGAKSPLSALRGRIHPAFGAKLIVTYHPAYLLRDPRQKKEAWADLQIAMRELSATAS